MNEEKIINLESKLAHQEALLDELNSALYAQQQTLAQVQKTLAAFVKRYKDLEGTNNVIGPADEKPPHY